MNSAMVVALLAAVLMAGGAVLLWAGAQRQDRRGLVSKRLEEWASTHPHEYERRADERTGVMRIAWFARHLPRSGLSFSQNQQAALVGLPLLLLPLSAILFGLWAALLLVLLYPAFLYGALQWQTRRFAAALVSHLPAYLDSVARSLAVGNTMPVALKLAMEQSPEPIPHVFRQVARRHELGVSIENALEQVAATFRIRELQLLASAVIVNSRYGGKMEVILSNIANAIREYDRAQRELVALTAETRLSAWILSALPLVILVMLGATNPAYIRGMWLDDSGRWLLLAAFGLDIAGTLILLRMARV